VLPLFALALASIGVVVAAIAASPDLRDFIAALVDRIRSALGLS
jgi:hypothetical protein